MHKLSSFKQPTKKKKNQKKSRKNSVEKFLKNQGGNISLISVYNSLNAVVSNLVPLFAAPNSHNGCKKCPFFQKSFSQPDLCVCSSEPISMWTEELAESGFFISFSCLSSVPLSCELQLVQCSGTTLFSRAYSTVHRFSSTSNLHLYHTRRP